MKQLKQQLNKIGHFLVSYDIEYVEGISGFAALGWGLYLLHAPNTFTTFPSFQSMKIVMGEYGWGTYAALIGFIQLVLVIFSPKHLTLRKIAAFFAMFLWFSITFGLILVSKSVIGIPVYSTFCLWNSWGFIRLFQRNKLL